jgi:hypothetical protein
MTREEITAKAPQEDRPYLQASSPSAVYAYARREGWITEAEYERAWQDHGTGWNYAGD